MKRHNLVAHAQRQETVRPLERKIPGIGTHRSGWPYALRALSPLFSQTANTVFDDYIERTFLSESPSPYLPYTNPWIAVCHHPPFVPSWYGNDGLINVFDTALFRESLFSLRGAITFAPHSAEWIAHELQVPTCSIRHPSAKPRRFWNIDRWFESKPKQVVQIGSYLRNITAIDQLRVPDGYHKISIDQSAVWISRAAKRCQEYYDDRKIIGNVEHMSVLSSTKYDDLLATSIVFVELIDAIANNTVLECIARNTPIVINRLPGPEYYLGERYPLFYNSLDEAHDMFDVGRVLAAHDYLRCLDKKWLSDRAFLTSVTLFLQELALA